MLPQQISYTPFNKVSEIVETNGERKVNIKYEPDFRRKQVTGNGSHLETIYVGKGFERHAIAQANQSNNQDGVYDISYVYGKDGLLAFYLIKTDTSDNDPMIGQLYYVHKDHLGSPIAITDQNGEVVARYSYDAWGRTRNPYDLTYSDIPEAFGVFNRGYTGHEHIRDFDLINMNGRVFDPITARFLSPDNYIQMSSNTQNLNRYSYCFNNPLIYTDPDGEWIHLVVGAVIGGTINWIANGAEFSWEGLGYFGVGAAAGALGAGVGAGISSAMAVGSAAGGTSTFAAGFLGTSAALPAASSFATGAAIGAGAGFTSGFVTGTGNGLIQGQNLGEALLSGTKSGIIGGATGALLGGVTGGIDAHRDGRSFWNGTSDDPVINGWRQLEGGGYKAMPGERQLYYKNKSGAEIPSFRVDNLANSGSRLNSFDLQIENGVRGNVNFQSDVFNPQQVSLRFSAPDELQFDIVYRGFANGREGTRLIHSLSQGVYNSTPDFGATSSYNWLGTGPFSLGWFMLSVYK